MKSLHFFIFCLGITFQSIYIFIKFLPANAGRNSCSLATIIKCMSQIGTVAPLILSCFLPLSTKFVAEEFWKLKPMIFFLFFFLFFAQMSLRLYYQKGCPLIFCQSVNQQSVLISRCILKLESDLQCLRSTAVTI